MFDGVKAGREIAVLRKKRGLTQEELATRLNISPQAVSKWENGHAMPELSLLVELADALGSTLDDILFPDAVRPAANANFEHILLPYAPIADFSGVTWPRSMAYPAVLSAVKLFMGLEEHKDPMGRQINDDTEYILQSAVTSICFGYSWGTENGLETGLSAYGLTGELYSGRDRAEEELIRLAVKNILGGYPVVILPQEYSEIILATGFSHQGKVMKGLPFLDGDDEKNSVMSFQQLKSFPNWYGKKPDILLIKPGPKPIPLPKMCRDALQKGVTLLRNETSAFDEPLVGYGAVIYDNWCRELQKESNQNLVAIECVYPHIFIHYEGKLRIKQFFELSMRWMEDVDHRPFTAAVSKYEEIISMCEKCLRSLSEKSPETAEESKEKRKMLMAVLRRSKELEMDALQEIASVIL
ncbi:MAG: helix-turn-helix domain-containing protein [Acutalibacter sp.]|nr:helix-turn-helix domain-containing protein [Acutalibacter sp.]